MFLGKVKHIHFIGIGGAGMSGLAEVMINVGFRVSGSDLVLTEVTHHLEALGATVYGNHAPDNGQFDVY